MKKIKLLVLLLLLSVNFITAQKAKIKNRKINVTYNRPDFLQNIKTYSYTIQDDGEYWNFVNDDDEYAVDLYPNLTSLTDGIKIKGLTKVENNADLNIVVGFIGNQLKIENALIKMSGTLSVMYFIKDKLMLSNIENITLKAVAGTKFPTRSRADRNKTKATMVTNYIQKQLDNQAYLFNNTVEENVPFGIFKKAKGESEKFNIASEKLISNITDKATLEKAIIYWKEQLKTDFGKKMKDKVKNKVININLASSYLLLDNLKEANNYYKISKESAGLFDSWVGSFKRLINKKEVLSSLDYNKFKTIEITPNVTYFINVNEGGTYYYKKKVFKFSKIEISRFTPNIKSNMASLNTVIKPKVHIYNDGKKILIYNGGEKHKIITDSGKEIIFKETKKVFKPYIKKGNDYILFYGE